MTLVTLTGLAEGDHVQWELGAGSTKVSAVAANDGDTSQIRSTGDGEYQSFTLQGKPGAIAAVQSLKAQAVIRTGDGSGGSGLDITGRLGARLSGTTLMTYSFGPGLTNSYTSTGNQTVNRPGGGAWGPDDILSSTFQLVILCDNAGSAAPQELKATQMDMLLDYSPPSGGFTFLIGSLVAVSLAEMAGIAREVYARTGSLIQPHEYAPALADLRAHTFPTYFLLG